MKAGHEWLNRLSAVDCVVRASPSVCTGPPASIERLIKLCRFGRRTSRAPPAAFQRDVTLRRVNKVMCALNGWSAAAVGVDRSHDDDDDDGGLGCEAPHHARAVWGNHLLNPFPPENH